VLGERHERGAAEHAHGLGRDIVVGLAAGEPGLAEHTHDERVEPRALDAGLVPVGQRQGPVGGFAAADLGAEGELEGVVTGLDEIVGDHVVTGEREERAQVGRRTHGRREAEHAVAGAWVREDRAPGRPAPAAVVGEQAEARVAHRQPAEEVPARLGREQQGGLPWERGEVRARRELVAAELGPPHHEAREEVVLVLEGERGAIDERLAPRDQPEAHARPDRRVAREGVAVPIDREVASAVERRREEQRELELEATDLGLDERAVAVRFGGRADRERGAREHVEHRGPVTKSRGRVACGVRGAMCQVGLFGAG
jgi:hypothetical protein